MKKILGFLILFFVMQHSIAQSNFYQIDSVQKIEIYFHESNWDRLLDSLKALDAGYLKADSVKINGVNFANVGVKYKGNSSYSANQIKNPFTIKLDKYTSQNYQGYKSIKLANCYDDPSMIREVLAYQILQKYMHCPQSNFANVMVNGVNIGLYSNDEDITKPFILKHFGSSGNTFFKCSPLYASPAFKANLKYIGLADSSYKKLYEIQSTALSGWQDLIRLCDTLSNVPQAASELMNMDRVIWMLAFNNAIVNLDSYSGVFSQNYFIYKDNSGFYNPIVWDLNMAFGGFNFVGTPNNGTGTLALSDMQQLSPSFHSSHSDWPLIQIVMNDVRLRKMYFAHFKTIFNEMIANQAYENLALQLQNTIRTAVQADQNKFFTNNDFENGMNGNVVINGRTVPGIKTLMAARLAYLQNQSEFKAVAPSLSSVACLQPNAQINDRVYIHANIANTTYAALYYRSDSTAAFNYTEMFDDGLHQDEQAGDGIFGANFLMQSAQAQYYIYTENNNAGSFAPARAAHEYYRVPGQAIYSSIVNNTLANKNLQIFPNPTKNNLQFSPFPLSAMGSSFFIYNSLGQMVYRNQFNQSGIIELPNLNSGVYVLQFEGQKMVFEIE